MQAFVFPVRTRRQAATQPEVTTGTPEHGVQGVEDDAASEADADGEGI